MTRFLAVAFATVAASSFAQVDDFESSSPAPAPAPVRPAPSRLGDDEPVRPTRDAGAAPVSAPVSPARRSNLGDATPKADGGAIDGGLVVDDSDTTVVSRKERFAAGTEPHSPSTWNLRWDAPGNARVSVGQAGIGTIFTPTARLGRKGVVRVSFLGEYLNQNDFPVVGAQDIRSAITFAASFQPFDWGELFVAYGASANSNNRTSPTLIQALGDLTFGVKLSHEWAKGLHAGVDLRFLTFSGVGNQSVDRFAVGFRPTLLGTYDFRALNSSVPLIFTVGLGVTIDSTAGLTTQTLNASEEFALNINRYHRFNFHAALEVPFPVIAPIIEYSLAAPLGVANGELTGPDGKFIGASAAMPQTLGVGLKITAIKDLSLLTGFNFGLTRSVGLGVPATPPWNFFVGAAFAIDPFQRPETTIIDTVRERKVEQPRAVLTRLEGQVRDSATSQPIVGAIVRVAGVVPAATDDSGRYQTIALETPKAETPKAAVSVSKDGYTPQLLEVSIDPSAPTRLDVSLVAEAKKSTLAITVTADKKPVTAVIAIAGPETLKSTVQNGAAEHFEVGPGTYTVTVTADGFLSQTRDVQVQTGGTLQMAFDLVASPKKVLVIFRGDKIEILQQVRFATGKSTILPDSYNLLQQVVDAIVRNNVKRVRVEGHTDNRGNKAANQTLSDERARAVKDYLVSQGIDPQRLESVGYGDTKPVAPNLTARGRELNRRVEFIVLEK